MRQTLLLNLQTMISLVLALASAPVAGASGTVTATDSQLSPQLKDNGVTAVNPSPPIAPLPEAPATVPDAADTGSETNQEVNAQTIYNNLAVYGEWNPVAGVGWCWQPYSSLGYDYYQWGWLGYGSWRNFRTRGLCWVPSSHFRMSAYCQHVDALRGGRVSFANNRIASSRSGAGQFHSRNVTQPVRVGSPMVINHRAAGVRGSNFGAVRSVSGGFHAGLSSYPRVSSGFHGRINSGFHGGVSSSFHSGARGGAHFGGGGGFHGGGRGHR